MIGGIGGKDGSGSFCDTPMPSEFNMDGKMLTDSPGVFDGDPCDSFGEYRRTHSPNGPKEKIFDKANPLPSGEYDHF